MKLSAIERIEYFFKMKFKDVISDLHWKEKRSIKSLSDECKVSRDSFQKLAKKHNLDLRSIQEATKLTKNKGKDHWAFGLRKDNSDWAKSHSDRMKKNNPMKNFSTREKRAVNCVEHLRKMDLPQEKLFAKILKSLNVSFEAQKPVGPYNCDFFLSDIGLCIEIDSSNKWGVDKKKKALKRDEYMLSKGVTTLRINKNKLGDKKLIINILKANNIIG